MSNRSLTIKALACVALLALGSKIQTRATLTVDECTQGSGCFTLASGAKVNFNFTANFEAATKTQTGQLVFSDSTLAQGGLTLNSSTLLEITVMEPNVRQYEFDLSGTAYGQARLTVTDNGDTGDTIQIQLLDTSGVPVYDTLTQTLSADCPGSITIGSCVVPSPCQLEVTAMCSMAQSGGGQSSPSGECTVSGTSGQVTFIY
ncbi:MAG TPA: hypothetical protein VI282_12235, partial [Verrucomicrobiae bacterium]